MERIVKHFMSVRENVGKDKWCSMHKKRIYKALAIAISITMVLPFSSLVGAESEEGSAVESSLTEEDGSGESSGEDSGSTSEEVTPTPTAVPTENPTAEPTTAPGPTATAEPTAEPTTTPTEEPTKEPTPTKGKDDDSEPTGQPSAEPTKEATPTPSTDSGSESGNSSDSDSDSSGSSTPINETSQFSSNSDLIASQNITVPAARVDSWRFKTIDKVYAISKVKKLNILEEKSDDARIVGTLKKNGLCYVIQEEEDGEWLYVESGVVRGFVKKSDLTLGDDAETYVNEKTEDELALAESKVDPLENSALTYTKTTVRETVVDKVYALTKKANVNVREGMSSDAQVVGLLPENGICFILADDLEDGWAFVESGSVRGFVKKEYLTTGTEAESTVAAKGGWTDEQEKEYQDALTAYESAKEANTDKDNTEQNEAYTQAKETLDSLKEDRSSALSKGEGEYETADQKIKPSENAACYYTLTSVQDAGVATSIGLSMVEYAKQFIGNPYVWGGTSLTNGADCSGFVQQIYAQFGYEIPRTSREQSQCGTQIPVEDAQPGDLIFYANGGTVYHVVMYAGDGQTIEAANSKQGILQKSVNYDKAVWAVRIISDDDTDKIEEVNEKADEEDSSSTTTTASSSDYGELLGTFKLTAYCNCSICSGQWAGGPTASGTTPTQGRTVAMAGVPFGTKLIINGQIYTVEDRGTPYGHVDIYFNDHNEASDFGVQYAEVYLAN